MADTGTEFETFSPAEKAYFDSNGEAPIEADEPDVEGEDVSEEEQDSEGTEVKAEEKAETEDAEKEPEKPRKDQRVPLRKLQEEVNARRELEKQHEALKEQWARADERLKALFQEKQPEPAKEPEKPDPTTDPIGFIQWQQQQLEQVAATQRQTQEEYQRQAQINAIDQAYKQSWSVFATETPDALDAYGHYIAVTQRMLERRGFTGDALQQQVQNEERRVALQALQANVSPAEWIYEDAKMMGYAPKAAAAPNDTAKKAEADIERREKAANASRSLSSAGGERASMPTVAELASMSDEEFAEFEKRNPRAFKKLMGG